MSLSPNRLARRPLLWLLALTLVLPGCFGRSSSDEQPPAISIQLTDYPYTPDGSDVSAELGGKGFADPGGPAEKEGWKTSDPESVGDPRAVKGGSITTDTSTFSTLRFYGKDSGNLFVSTLRSLTFLSLLQIDGNTREFMPGLCTHWWISEDKLTYRFRLDPKARWNDGKPVTTDDVLATYRLIMNAEYLAAIQKASLEQIEEPRIISKYIFEIRAKEPAWIIFNNVADLSPLPAHFLAEKSVEQLFEEFNFAYPTSNGPYILRPEDVKVDQHVILTRNTEFWAADRKQYQGLFNFDRLRFMQSNNPRIAFDRIIKGESDFHENNTSKWWVEETNVDAIENGWLVKQQVFNEEPQGFQGHMFNMRRSPYDDIRVRKALTKLFDRDKMLHEFAYDLYLPLYTYFPASPYANPDNEPIVYDLEGAKKLLDEAGWNEVGPDGVRVKDGRRLSVPVQYAGDFYTKYVTTYKEMCRPAGVEIELVLNDPTLQSKNRGNFAFDVSMVSWSAGLFPEPRGMWHSAQADKTDGFNFPGFMNAEADAIIEEYEREFDIQKRYQLIRRLDALIYEQYPYMLQWYNPSKRFLYWDKFGMPESMLTRIGNQYDVLSMWWEDPEKVERLKAAREKNMPLEKAPAEVRYWESHPLETAAKS